MSTSNKIAPLHDALRWSCSDGRIFMTDGLEPAVQAKILDGVLTFAHFSTDMIRTANMTSARSKSTVFGRSSRSTTTIKMIPQVTTPQVPKK